jgi:hypothetical protein
MNLHRQQVEEEQRAGYVRALLEERRGHLNDPARVEAINAELTRMGHKATAPAERAETRRRRGVRT